PGINRPIPGYNYAGPGNNGYDKPPVNSVDACARPHDLSYDDAHASGIQGALFNTTVADADLALADCAANAVATDPKLSVSGKAVGVAMVIIFTDIGLA